MWPRDRRGRLNVRACHDVAHAAEAVMEADRWAWYNTRAPARLGLAAPVAELLAAVLDAPLDETQ